MKIESITAIVCTYNRYELLAKCMKSLVGQNTNKIKFKIIVVDNTPRELRNASVENDYINNTNVTYIYEDTPGLSNARNVGISKNKSQVVSFIDDDAIASAEWAIKVIEAFNSNENVGVVGGKINPIWEVSKPDWLTGELFGYVSVVNWGDKLKICEDHEWIAGANISFLAEALTSVKFDTNLGRNGSGSSLMSNEEIVLVNELKLKGYKVVYSPHAYVDHLVEKNRMQQDWFRKRIVWQAISDYLSNSKNIDFDKSLFYALSYIWEARQSERNLLALYSTKKNGCEFKSQLNGIYNLTIALLSGLKSVSLKND